MSTETVSNSFVEDSGVSQIGSVPDRTSPTNYDSDNESESSVTPLTTPINNLNNNNNNNQNISYNLGEENIKNFDVDDVDDDDDYIEDDNNEEINDDDTIINNDIKNTMSEINNSDDDDDDDDDEEEFDENYLKKFDENLKRNIIQDYHPEIIQHNYEEIDALTKIVRNEQGVIIDPLHRTLPFITKYEKARILGDRARQINSNSDSKPFVKIEPFIIDGYTIALKEFEEKKIPFIIKRPLPNGGTEYWKLKDLEILI